MGIAWEGEGENDVSKQGERLETIAPI